MVHQDFESGITKKDRTRITSASDKQFPSLDDFRENGPQFFDRERAACSSGRTARSSSIASARPELGQAKLGDVGGTPADSPVAENTGEQTSGLAPYLFKERTIYGPYTATLRLIASFGACT